MLKTRWTKVGASGLGALVVLALAHPAVADSTVVVRGTDLPVGTGLAHVGCASPYAATGSPRPYVGQVPGAPLGSRSLGVTTSGGSAAGPVAYTGSVADVSVASVSAHAPGGTTGVAWVGYQAPADAGTSTVWFGQAPLSVPGSGWTSVSAAGRTLDWKQYDATTGAVLADGPTATVAALVAEHGDGPGLYALGLGCDGASVDLDGFRFGTPGDVTTYDLEGLATSVTMLGGRTGIVAGETVTLRNELTATGGATIPHATAILERREGAGGSGAWQTVRVVDAGASAIVEPAQTTTYRWRFVDRPLAEGSTSDPFVVEVAAAVTARTDDGAVTGRVSPGGPGRVVQLRPSADAAPVATARTADDGSFTLPLDGVDEGRYVVTTLASQGNTRGVSSPVQVGPSPSTKPTTEPTTEPTREPTADPTSTPTARPTSDPTVDASEKPEKPSEKPTEKPTARPTPSPTPSRDPEPTTPAATTTPQASLPPSEDPSQDGSGSASVSE